MQKGHIRVIVLLETQTQSKTQTQGKRKHPNNHAAEENEE
jgi:hypothetical protein